ncbi:MAG: VOC family protein [Azospirillum sp.]|nr:VOC family protein [Azospirillum sp.]
MFSHITVGSDDIAQAAIFYDAVLAPLGLGRYRTFKIGIGYAPIGFDGIEPPFWVLRPFDRAPARAGNGCHVAFLAPDRAAVDAFHAAALAAGGTDEGAPGLRRYHRDYYGAYVRDRDGNKLQAVCHAPDPAESRPEANRS